jgi:APA family basic amino acid/polyamine antiporter
VWIFGAILTLFGGLTSAELGAMIPEAGGQYVYLREAYGPQAGFMYGWTAFLITQTGGIAALAVGFAEYLAYFIPAFGLDRYLFQWHEVTLSAGQIIALLSIGILSAVNYYGIRSGSFVQNVFTLLKLVAIAVLVVSGLYIVSSAGVDTITDSNVSVPEKGGNGFFGSVGVALIAVLWTYDGWYSVNSVASEIKNVKRNLPLSLIIGIAVIGITYLIVNIFYVTALPMEEMAGEVRIGEKAMGYAFGSTAGSLMAGLILISILGCLSATILFGPRIYYAMAKDGLFIKKFSYVHESYHTPSIAIVWQAIWSALLCLTGSYEQLFTYVMFAVLLFYVVTVVSIFVLRKKRPNADRPYRAWGYPVVPAIFALVMLLIMVNTLIERPVESILGTILIIAGLPVYYRRQKKRNNST